MKAGRKLSCNATSESDLFCPGWDGSKILLCFASPDSYFPLERAAANGIILEANFLHEGSSLNALRHLAQQSQRQTFKNHHYLYTTKNPQTFRTRHETVLRA